MKNYQLFSIVAAGVLCATGAIAQETDPAMACGSMMPGMMGEKRGEIMQWHQKMMEKFKAQNAELDKMVQEMNAASGDKKVEAIAAIINKVMEERKAWFAEMEARHNKMMEWMQNKKGNQATPTPQ